MTPAPSNLTAPISPKSILCCDSTSASRCRRQATLACDDGNVTEIAWTTLGNRGALAQLERALLTNSPAHAYMFSGPEGVGKLRAAMEFAAALNCESERKPCGVCRSCLETLAN